MNLKSVAQAGHQFFRKIFSSTCNNLLNVTKYQSCRTGLTVTIADVDGPTVNGFICLATEDKSDDGLPHTLEHLVFMGSEHYQTKGLLDILANRCLASGTNAMTETHYTCYTLETAGYEGFLIMLPIYLDHLFHPLLTDAQFTTEVHHINGEGEDAGVVYCEMQDYESDMETLTLRSLSKAMFAPDCGYSAYTGGQLPNLRTSTTNEKIKKFHEKFYHPKNFNVIITGTIDHRKVFDSLEPVEKNLIEKGIVAVPFERPWSSPVAPLDQSVDIVQSCPVDDDSKGLVAIGWRGPEVRDQYNFTAVSVLLEYLTDSSVSPLRQRFVEIVDPYCSKVSTNIEEYSVSMIYVLFKGTFKAKLSEIKPKLFETLKSIATVENFDMNRMKDILQQSIDKTLSCMENPHAYVSDCLIFDFLFGNDEKDFVDRLNDVDMYKRLLNEDVKFWTKLLSKYFVENKYVSVIGEPNSQLVGKMTSLEKERIEKQKSDIGESRLKELAEKLENSIEENEENEPDPDLMAKCIVNSIDGINFFNFKHYANFGDTTSSASLFPLSNVPFNVILDDFKQTNFLNLNVQLDTSRLDKSLRNLLPLWTALIFESPIERDGQLVPYEEIVKAYNRDLVSCGIFTGLGFGSGFKRMWTREFLYCVKFVEDRVRIVAQRLANSAAQQKRNGNTVAMALLNHLIYDEMTNVTVETSLHMEDAMNDVLKRLDSEPNTIIQQLETVHNIASHPNHVVVHMTCSLNNLKKFNAENASFENSLCNILTEDLKKTNITPNESNFLGPKEPTYLKSPSDFGHGAIIGLGSTESTFVYTSTPLSLKRTDQDFAKLKVLLQYLSMCEGPMWRMCRGRGIAYHCGIDVSGDVGLMTLCLYRTSHPVQCFEETKKLVEDILKEEEEIDEDDFDAAKRSLISEIVQLEETVHCTSNQTLLSHYRGVELDYNRRLMKSIWQVEMDAMVEVGKKYLQPLFDFEKSTTSITCHPSKLQETVDGFARLGCRLVVKKLEDNY